MAQAFEIDFIRQIIIQTLQKEHINNPSKYIGSDNQIRLTSFYEHLASDEEVDRYVETVRDLTNQQNRTGLIANGVIVAPSNPTITNLNQCTIIPLEFSLNFRCTLADRDIVKESLNNMVSILKGRKHDIAEFDNGQLFLVGTIGNNSVGAPQIRNGDFIGKKIVGPGLDGFIKSKINTLATTYSFINNADKYLYYEEALSKVLKVAVLKNGNWYEQVESEDYPDIIFPPAHTSFKKWKLSMSFDSFHCQEPRTLNANDYCDLSFGGSATLASEKVLLGNEITKVGIMFNYVQTSSGKSTYNHTTYPMDWIEPLDISSGNIASTIENQLHSNNFVTNTHTDGLSIRREYTFVCDLSITMINRFFKYARYKSDTVITPNIVYLVREVISSWGQVNVYDSNARIIETIEINNNESDVMTITLPLQIQGEND